MATSDKLTYLATTKGYIKDAINLTNAGITSETTFRNYAKKLRDGYVDLINNGTDDLYNNMPHLTGKSKQLSLSPSYEAPMKITCYGDTSQYTTTGKNLLNPDFVANWVSGYIPVEANKPYIYSESGVGSACFVYFYETPESTGTYTYVGANETYTPTNNGYVRINKGTSSQINLMLEQNTQVTSYEPYTGGIPSPNPDYPQDINNITGDNTIRVCGKNLASDKWEDYTYTGTYAIFPVTLEQGATYKLKATRVGELKPTYYNYGIIKDGTDYSSFVGLQTCVDYGTGGVNSVITITIDSSWVSPKLVCYVYGNPQGKFEELMTNFNIQLEKGNQATTYEPYTGQDYTISLGTTELCKIGTYQDKIFKSSGKNLFDGTYNHLAFYDTAVGESMSFTENANYLGAYCKVEAGKTYSISKLGTTNRFRIAVSTNIPTDTLTGLEVGRDDSATKIENITIPNGYNYLSVYLSNNSGSSDNVNLMINEGTTALPYEPYGTDWYKYSAIGKVVLDGSENWNKFNNFLYYNNMSFELSPENSYTIPNLLSDKFTIVSFNDLSLNPKIYMSANQLGDRNNQRGVSLYVCDNYDSVATLKTWLSTHNTEVYYVLANPTYTKITDSTLIGQLQALKSKYGTTNISSDMVLGITALKEE